MEDIKDIKDIKDMSDALLEKLTAVLNRDCQPGKYSLIEIRDKYAKNTDMLYIIENGEPVYFLLLDRFPKHKSVYIHDVCVSMGARGRGLFKASLGFLKTYYATRGFTNFTLDASDSTKEVGLDQKARLHIFGSAGFHINTETGYFTEDGNYEIMKTRVQLDDGSVVTMLGRSGADYVVVDDDGGKHYTVGIKRVEKCYDGAANQISCPMIMRIPVVGKGKGRGRRKTRKQIK